MVAEIALAFVLLVGAGLLIQSFSRLQRVSPGFNPEHVLTAGVSLLESPDPGQPARIASFYPQLLERVGNLPGVRAASAVWPVPLSVQNAGTGVDLAGRTVAPSDRAISFFRAVTPHYLHVMRIPLRSGRDLEARDDQRAAGVAIINEAFALKYFPGENPLGKRITPQMSAELRDPIEREIVGVVGDVKSRRLSAEDGPEVSVPHGQFPGGTMTLVLRTEQDPEAFLPPLRKTVEQLDRNLSLSRPRTMEHYIAASVAQPRLNMVLLGIFGLVAVTLTAVGLYGVMACTVSQRRQEIGIRLALGALPSNVLGLVVDQDTRLALLGVVLGVPLAWGSTRLLSGLLYGVGASDPLTFIGVALLLTVVALVACYLPARRAAGLDPVAALRAD